MEKKTGFEGKRTFIQPGFFSLWRDGSILIGMGRLAFCVGVSELDVSRANAYVAIDGLFCGGIVFVHSFGEGADGVGGGNRHGPNFATEDEGCPINGVESVVACHADEVAEGGWAEDWEDDVGAVRNTPFCKGLACIGIGDILEPRDFFGRMPNTADSSDRVNDEAAELLACSVKSSLESVIDESDGESDVFVNVVDTIANKFGENEFVATGDGANDETVKFVVEGEDGAVDRFNRVKNADLME